MIFEESIRHPDVHEIGDEWFCYQALGLLQLKGAEWLQNLY